MSTDPRPVSSPSPGDGLDWSGVEELLRDVARLSQVPTGSAEFAQALTARLLTPLGGLAACLWSVDRDQPLSFLGESLVPEATSLNWTDWQAPRRRFLEAVVSDNQAAVLDLSAELSGTDRGSVEPGLWSLAAPIRGLTGAIGVLELLGRGAPGASRDFTSRLAVLESLTGFCGDHFRIRRMADLEADLRSARDIVEFATDVGRSLDTEVTARRIADRMRRWIPCDRCSVLRRAREFQTLAVSGAPNVDRRSGSIRRLEELVQAVWAAGRMNEVAGHKSHGDDPATAAALTGYLDSTGVRSVEVLPLLLPEAHGEPETDLCVGALVCDWFTAAPESRRGPGEDLLQLAAQALSNSAKYGQVPWGAAWNRFWGETASGARRRWRWLAGVACAIALIPLRFEVPCEGELQPAEQRQVFAVEDAVVERLEVGHGDRVTAGDLLAELRSPRLDLERQRILGELEATRQRLNALEAARLGSEEGSTRRDRLAPQLSGEEAGLRELVRGLERQAALLEAESGQLSVRAPINGQILTWDPGQRLLARPVQRGQALLTIGNPTGPWRLELRVSNRWIGHVPGTHDRGRMDVPVRFSQVTEPARWQHGTVERISAAVDSDPAGTHTVRVIVAVEAGSVRDPRPGEGVRARIWCGWRPAVYVWFHELFSGFRSWFQF